LPYRLDFVSSARREFLALPLDVRRRIDAQLVKLPDMSLDPGAARA